MRNATNAVSAALLTSLEKLALVNHGHKETLGRATETLLTENTSTPRQATCDPVVGVLRSAR
jgi:hypothetical protein